MDLRERRRRAGLSQRVVAERSGIAQPNISAYESGRLIPSPATLDRLLEATRARPSALVDLHREAILALAAEHHASEVQIFGSVAAGTDTTASDLDLLVHFSSEASLYDQIDLTHGIEELLGITVDVVSDSAHGTAALRPRRPL